MVYSGSFLVKFNIEILKLNLFIHHSWFAIHPNGINKTNTLIEGDNTGWASEMLEAEFSRPDRNVIVARFFLSIGYF